jgi:general stress protein 26
MGDKKNLTGTDAAAKIKELAKEIDTCMFCTYDGDKLISRPMSSQHVDEQGNIWFLSDKNSEKNRELAANDKVELLYGQGHDKYLAIKGNATISFDREKIKELWDPIAKIWFKDGVDDDAISVIKVAFKEGYYWDVKHNKMVEFTKMATSLVTGKTMDDGIEGTLHQ